MWDTDAWKLYPNLRYFYDKLHLSTRLGYNCGPAGMSPVTDGTYIIRPVINLIGMGVGSYVVNVTEHSKLNVEPGKFWCEYFAGKHFSIDYTWKDGELLPTFACMGYNTPDNLSKFTRWIKVDIPDIKLPEWIKETESAKFINIEFINDKIIEIHLRHSHDFPAGATEIIPVWEDSPKFEDYYKYFYIDNYDDGDGFLPVARLGFYYR